MCDVNIGGYLFVIGALSAALLVLMYMVAKSFDYSEEVAARLRYLQGDLEINALILSGKHGSFGKIHGENASHCMMNVVSELGIVADELDGGINRLQG